MTLLSLKNVALQLDSMESAILNGISLDIFPGDFIVLLGKNGSGKSSLLKVINGLATPTSGTIEFGGKNLLSRSMHTRSQSIVTLTQDLHFSTFSSLTVFENCLIAMHRKKRISLAISAKKEREEVFCHLGQFSQKLASRMDTPVSQLSGGERQTLAFAMGLWETPALLLLDEHTSALDPAMAQKLMRATSEAISANQITTIMTTHNLEDALLYGNRLIAMHNGAIVLDVAKEKKERLTREDLLAVYSESCTLTK